MASIVPESGGTGVSCTEEGTVPGPPEVSMLAVHNHNWAGWLTGAVRARTKLTWTNCQRRSACHHRTTH